MPQHFIEGGNYIVTLSDVSLDARPVGSLVVPARPGPDHQWQGGQWIYVAPTPVAIAEVPKFKFEKALKASRKDGTLAAPGDPRAFGDTRNAVWSYDADARDEYEARSTITRDIAVQPSVRHGAIVMRLAVAGLSIGIATPGEIVTATAEADLFLDRIFARAANYPG